MKSFDLLSFRQEIIESKIVLSFEGKMSQGVLVSLVDTLKEKLKVNDQDSKQYMVRKIFAIFVELAQNIQNHSIESEVIEGRETGAGIIVIREDEDSFMLSSGNNITLSAAEKLKIYCDELNQPNADELKKLYKQQLRSKRNEEATGAGLGLIDIIRKSGNPLIYEIQSVDKNTQFFTLSVNLPKVH
jgi:hypothetical protein